MLSLCTFGYLLALQTMLGAEGAVINQGAGYEPIQQLAHDKLNQMTHQLANQHQHQHHHQQVTANDLQELPEPPQQPQQQQQQQSAAFGRPMINGNQATYVEPPADFKPIIYDMNSINQPAGSGPVFEAGSAGGSQESAREPAGMSWAGSELKPSIGRWSDWHDMSIEPDLASSDSSPPSMVAAPPPPPPSVAYRTRYFGGGANGVAGATRTSARRYQADAAKTTSSSSSSSFYQQELEQRDDGQTEAGGVAGPSGNQVNAASAGQVKGGQQAPLPLHQHHQQPHLHSPGQLKAAGAELPLKLISGLPVHQQQTPKNGHNPHHLNHATPSAAAWRRQQQQQQANHNHQNANHNHNQFQLPDPQQQQQQQQAQQVQQRRGLGKRRRKSKSNAEVRIQQLVAASQLQQQQHQDHQQLLLMREAGTGSSSKNKQVNGLSGALNQLMEHQQPQLHHPQRLGQRVSSALVRPANGANGVQVLRRFAPAGQQLNLTTTAAAARPVASSQHQSASRAQVAQRRRRIKTLLPVGLSSWFLGGIRDLDGRHWHLPSEVINRLAVNDVDFGPRPQVVAPAPSELVAGGGVSGGQEQAIAGNQSKPATNGRPELIPR